MICWQTNPIWCDHTHIHTAHSTQSITHLRYTWHWPMVGPTSNPFVQPNLIKSDLAFGRVFERTELLLLLLCICWVPVKRCLLSTFSIWWGNDIYVFRACEMPSSGWRTRVMAMGFQNFMHKKCDKHLYSMLMRSFFIIINIMCAFSPFHISCFNDFPPPPPPPALHRWRAFSTIP